MLWISRHFRIALASGPVRRPEKPRRLREGEVHRTLARQKNGGWYVGSMTNWEARDLEIPLNFLGAGEYDAQFFADGPDADKVATSLAISTQRVKAGDRLQIHLAPGGGWAAALLPRK